MNRRVATLQWRIGLLAATSAVVLSVWARLPLPYRDDWDWFRWLLEQSSAAAYFVPHNEHVIPLPRLLLRLQYALEGSNGYTMLVTSLGCLATIALLTLREIRRRWSDDPAVRHWVGGVALTLLFFAWQLQSMVFPAAVLFPLVEMFAVVALVCLVHATDVGARRSPWLAAAALAAMGAMLTTTNGLAVPVTLAIVAAGRRAGGRVVLGFFLMSALAGAAYFFVVLAGPASAGLPLDQMPPAWLVGAFFLAFYSSVVAQVNAAAGVLLGTILFAAGLAVLFTTAARGTERPRIEHFAVGLMLFTMASAALAARARAEFGIVQAAQSRYASFVLPFWTALVLALASRVDQRWLNRLTVPMLLASVAALVAQAGIGAVWIAKADNVAAAGLALSAGVKDDEWMRTLHPVPETVYDVAARLKADGDRSLGEPLRQLSVDAGAIATGCDADVQLVAVAVGAGLRLSGVASVSSETGIILDRTGRTVGLARPAPIAATPNPAPMEVARAVARAALSLSEPREAWMGFATVGEGGPYAFVPLGTSNAPLCRVSVAGP